MAITFINSTNRTISANASTWSIATHSSLEGGATLILGMGFAGNVTVSTITDNTGTVYKRAVASTTTPSTTANMEMWYGANISSLSTRVSITLSGNSSGLIGMAQFQGVSTNNAFLDGGSSHTAAASSQHGCVTVTPSENNALIVLWAYLGESSVGTVSTGSSMTQILSIAKFWGGYQIQNTANSCSGGFRTSSQVSHVTIIGAFSDTAGAGGGGSAPMRIIGGRRMMLRMGA